MKLRIWLITGAKMTKWNNLNRNKTPNKYSPVKIERIKSSVKEQVAKCKKLGGTPTIQNELYIDNKKVKHIIPRLLCLGCQIDNCKDRKRSGLNRGKPPRLTSAKTRKRNGNWKKICLERGNYLKEKYGNVVCEYSGETITVLSSVPNSQEDGWGHHIDGRRNNQKDNCYIIKYRYHRFVTENNLQVKSEDFQGCPNINKPKPLTVSI
jgi:hypothetical protein